MPFSYFLEPDEFAITAGATMSDEQRLRHIQTDPRPTDELIQLALSQDEEEHDM